MKLTQAIRVALAAIWSNKLRSFLTMLGVIIGVFAVVALVSIGQGATQAVTDQVQGMGSNLITLNITGRGPQRGISFADATELVQREGIAAAAPVISQRVTVKYRNKSTTPTLDGTTATYGIVRNQVAQAGRYISSLDLQYRQNVAVVGVSVVEDLFAGSDPLGQQIRIMGTPFTIVGVLEEKGSGMTGSNDNRIVIPITTAQRLLKTATVQTIYIQADSADVVDRVITSLEATLKMRFRDENAYSVFNQAQILDVMDQISGTLTIMLGGIAGISLLVGGIGIMNIMLVSVTERTREIGICKALGAKRRDIQLQFLIESAVLSAIGGIGGMALGYVVIDTIRRFTTLTPIFSLRVVATAVLFSLFVGIFFGMYPANKASKLNPIDALRGSG
ncbi:MAG: ABC transporter permease [Firmicutes bacterium]|nr:ABC transporter permease [Bacillota bacterium]